MYICCSNCAKINSILLLTYSLFPLLSCHPEDGSLPHPSSHYVDCIVATSVPVIRLEVVAVLPAIRVCTGGPCEPCLFDTPSWGDRGCDIIDFKPIFLSIQGAPSTRVHRQKVISAAPATIPSLVFIDGVFLYMGCFMHTHYGDLDV